jgi:hypothetical protein
MPMFAISHALAGELIRVIDRGTSSMRVLLETMLFSIGPALIDVLGAAAYLLAKQVRSIDSCMLLSMPTLSFEPGPHFDYGQSGLRARHRVCVMPCQSILASGNAMTHNYNATRVQ